jgi:hypothetical protein
MKFNPMQKKALANEDDVLGAENFHTHHMLPNENDLWEKIGAIFLSSFSQFQRPCHTQPTHTLHRIVSKICL